MSYTLDNLLQDAASKRGKVAGADSDLNNYVEAWNAYVRYLTSCLEQRRGLNLPSFCKIGWMTEKKMVQGGKSKSVPFFQLGEQFARAYCPQEVGKTKIVGDREVSAFEDFNFSKAAIKHSQQLTKDQVFTGLKALLQQLGEACSDGKDIDIALEGVGRLIVKDREPRFSFSHQIYALEGAVPDDIMFEPSGGYISAPAFRKDAPEEARGLGIVGQDATQMQIPAPRQPTPQALPESAMYMDEEPMREPEMRSGIESDVDRMSRTPMLTSQQYKRELAYKEAMDRHISEMEARTTEAVKEKEAYHNHINDCLTQERDEMQVKRSRAQQNQYFLRQQVQWREMQKKDQRKDEIVAASAHDFPKFTEPAEAEMKEFMSGQAARMRADLDEQVRTNNTLRNLQKRRERSLEVDQLEANRMEMAMLREADRAKKAYDKEALATAWNSEIRMKNIWKAIENHNKVGSNASSHAPQVLNVEQLPPSRSGSSRVMTGSIRKVPLGASSSLSKLERVGSGR